MSSLLQFLGRLHVVLVHFPVSLVIVAAVVDFWCRKRNGGRPADAALVCLGFASLGALFAAGSGWLHAEYGELGHRAEGLLWWHRWGGCALAVLTPFALLLGHVARAARSAWSGIAYRLSLVAASALVGIVGHWGGGLVYGEGYLLDPFRTSPGEQELPVDAQAFLPVEAIFQEHCVECHGPQKQKGNLRLDSLAAILAPRDEGAVVIRGHPESSELLRLVSLPADDLDIMPSSGDPLVPEEIQAIIAWIEALPEEG